MRPHIREWLPLATQQMRLRNLVRIQGHNIECKGDIDGTDALVYYTLHSTKESAAFYTSEMLPQRHLQQKWAEICCPAIEKSNANCVCIKVWLRHPKQTEKLISNCQRETTVVENKEPISVLSRELKNVSCLSPNRLPRPPDKLLFTWAVYFSGLILLNQQTDIQFQANSLLFQINGDYFVPPHHFTAESLREQLTINYQRYSASVPKVSIPPPTDEFSINSPHVSRSSSPVTVDWQRDLLRMSKTRYVELNCLRTDVRRSYDLKKLLQMQNYQRQCLQRLRESVEIAAEIKQLSIHCITREQLLRKPRTTSLSSSSHSTAAYQHHSMGRTLSVLLAEQHEIDPHQLLRAQQLHQQLEVLRGKQRLLQTERDTYSKRITQLRQHLTNVSDARQQLQNWLFAHENQLECDKQELNDCYQQQLTLQQTKRQVKQHVERRMSSLCMELREIYPISRNPRGFRTICNIPFPNMDAYVSDAKYANNVCLENVSPMALSASLGYIAHLVHMIAVIINCPLRNPILHEGSRTRIMDIIKDIPYGSREFPLYTRSAIPSKPVKYAIYLLNQNIAQLCYDITGTRCDLRATIENISHIFTTLTEIEQNQREIQHKTTHTHPNNRLTIQSINSNSNSSNIANCYNDRVDGNSIDCLSKSHSSIDMNHVPVPTMTTSSLKLSSLLQMPSSQPMPIAERSEPQQRVCRSVGSYSDCEDDFKDIIDQCYSNSDSNIKFQN